MDKGLDIDSLRALLAFHSAAFLCAPHLRAAISLCRTASNIETAVREFAAVHGISLDWRSADEALEWLALDSHHALTVADSNYPELLSNLSDPPFVLFVRGHLAALRQVQIAIVGSRRATSYGRDIAYRMAQDLASRGVAVTSGLAYGIDRAAHEGALAGNGTTNAVFGCGVDKIYPARHRQLANKILEHGCCVSEFPLGLAPRPYYFPRRNRLIAGLSLGTVVVEAAQRSGSISTAIHAAEQGKEVFAVPGSIHNPQSAGTHALIRQGAGLVTSVDDVLEAFDEIGYALQPTQNLDAKPHDDDAATLDEQEILVLDLVGYDPVSFDELVMRSRLTATEVSSILCALEVHGFARAVAGNAYIKCADAPEREPRA